MDQDADLMQRMNYLADVYRVVKKNSHGNARDMTADEHKFIGWLIKSGYYNA